MNCFSHAYRFLDRDPHFVVGTCVPDWLSMVARKTRAREKSAAQFTDDATRDLAELAAGIVRHHRDDYWFHERREFVETNLQFAIELRELLGADAGFRPHLAGHILIEMLLDAFLTEQDPSQLDRYYELVKAVQEAEAKAAADAAEGDRKLSGELQQVQESAARLQAEAAASACKASRNAAGSSATTRRWATE